MAPPILDEVMDKVVHRLTDYRALYETYICGLTDNGFDTWPAHVRPGKECGFGEDNCP